MIVGVFLAHGNGKEALAQELLLTVVHFGLLATVGKCPAHGGGKICGPVDFTQKQGAAVRGHGAGRKFGHNGA